MAEMAPAKKKAFAQALRTIEGSGTTREKSAMKESLFASCVWEMARGYYVLETDMYKGEERRRGKKKKGEAAPTSPNEGGAGGGVGGGAGVADAPAGAEPLPVAEKSFTRKAMMRSGSRLRNLRPNPYAGLDQTEILEAELRRRILLMCKRSYWNQLEGGMIGRNAAKYLRSLSDAALNSDSAQLDEWRALENALSSRSMYSGLQSGPLTRLAIATLELLYGCAPTLLGWCALLKGNLLVHSVTLQHNVLLGFLNAREEAVEAVPKLLGEFGLKPEEDMRIDLHDITMGLHEDITCARGQLQELQERHFEVYSSIVTVIAARCMLHTQMTAANKLAHEGLLDHAEVQKLSEKVNTQMKRLIHRPPFIPLPNAMDVLRQVPWRRID